MPHSATDHCSRRHPRRVCLALLLAGLAAGPPGAVAETEQPTTGAAAAPVAGRTHMDETLRDSIDKLIVVAGQDPSERELSGSYEKATPGLYGGMGKGGALANPTAEIGPVRVGFPIPVLALPGMLAGGVAGATQREIQEFRDALAEEIEKASVRPLQNEKLARFVYQELRHLPAPEPGLFAPGVPVPEDADAVMYVDLPSISIDVDGGDAVLTTAARLKLTRVSDKANLYERTVYYQDRAPLANWTENDNALFRDYANFALHWLARELAAESFARVDRPQALAPAGSDSVKLARRNAWQGDSMSLTPTLAWTSAGDATPAAWDLEIYDANRLLYQQAQVNGNSHRLVTPLEPCGHYFWSVRPVYRADGALRVGPWMRKPPEQEKPEKDKKQDTALLADGIAGRNAAVAPAYLQDFPTLDVHCRATPERP